MKPINYVHIVSKGNPDFIWRMEATTSGCSPCSANIHEAWGRVPDMYEWVFYNNGLVITSPINLN